MDKLAYSGEALRSMNETDRGCKEDCVLSLIEDIEEAISKSKEVVSSYVDVGCSKDERPQAPTFLDTVISRLRDIKSNARLTLEAITTIKRKLGNL